MCLTCGNAFTTAELGKYLLWELVALRDKVKILQRKMKGSLDAAKAAAEYLNELVNDLQILSEEDDNYSGLL